MCKGTYVFEYSNVLYHIESVMYCWRVYLIHTTYLLGQAHIETQAAQPTQGRAVQVSVIHMFEYISVS
jgi:hypothetical protein